jgi:hypothetical protein
MTIAAKELISLMRILLTILCSALALFVYGQTGDYPDYRNKKESFIKVSDKPLRADLASFTTAGIEESIGKLPLKKISPTGYNRVQMNFKSPEVEVAIVTSAFSAGNRKMLKSGEYLVKIDNKPFYGSYGQIPNTMISSVMVLVGKDTVAIPPAAYADLYNVNFTYRDKSNVERTANAVYFSADGKRMYIYLLSRDRNGSFEVTWVIEGKTYLRRVLDWGFTQ